MQIEPGLIVFAVALGVFYLRILQLRSRKKKMEQEAVLARARKRTGKNKAEVLPPQPADPYQPPFKITSWWLVAFGIVLMCLGIIMRSTTLFSPEISQFWWLVATLGVVPFLFSFTV